MKKKIKIILLALLTILSILISLISSFNVKAEEKMEQTAKELIEVLEKNYMTFNNKKYYYFSENKLVLNPEIYEGKQNNVKKEYVEWFSNDFFFFHYYHANNLKYDNYRNFTTREEKLKNFLTPEGKIDKLNNLLKINENEKTVILNINDKLLPNSSEEYFVDNNDFEKYEFETLKNNSKSIKLNLFIPSRISREFELNKFNVNNEMFIKNRLKNKVKFTEERFFIDDYNCKIVYDLNQELLEIRDNYFTYIFVNTLIGRENNDENNFVLEFVTKTDSDTSLLSGINKTNLNNWNNNKKFSNGYHEKYNNKIDLHIEPMTLLFNLFSHNTLKVKDSKVFISHEIFTANNSNKNLNKVILSRYKRHPNTNKEIEFVQIYNNSLGYLYNHNYIKSRKFDLNYFVSNNKNENIKINILNINKLGYRSYNINELEEIKLYGKDNFSDKLYFFLTIKKDIEYIFDINAQNKNLLSGYTEEATFILNFEDEAIFTPKIKLTSLFKKGQAFNHIPKRDIEYIDRLNLQQHIKFFFYNTMVGIYNTGVNIANAFLISLEKYDFVAFDLKKYNFKNFTDQQLASYIKEKNKDGITIDLKNLNENKIKLYPFFMIKDRRIKVKDLKTFIQGIHPEYTADDYFLQSLEGVTINLNDYIIDDKNINLYYLNVYDNQKNYIDTILVDSEYVRKDERPYFKNLNSSNKIKEYQQKGLLKIKSEYDFIGWTFNPQTVELESKNDNEDLLRKYSPIYTSLEIKNKNDFLKNNDNIKDFKTLNAGNDNVFYALMTVNNKKIDSPIGADPEIEKTEEIGKNTEKNTINEAVKDKVKKDADTIKKEIKKDLGTIIKGAGNLVPKNIFKVIKIVLISFAVLLGLAIIVKIVKFIL